MIPVKQKIPDQKQVAISLINIYPFYDLYADLKEIIIINYNKDSKFV